MENQMSFSSHPNLHTVPDGACSHFCGQCPAALRIHREICKSLSLPCIQRSPGGDTQIHRLRKTQASARWSFLFLAHSKCFPFLQEQQATVKEHSYLSPPLSERKHSGPGSSRLPYSSFSTANSSLSLPPGFSTEFHIA